MWPTDLTCIYSTLLLIQSQANKLNIDTPCITSDQPLWYKASGICRNIVCRFGGFQTLMSCFGAIGVMMSGSGIEESFIEIYAGNVVPHMMSGKAFSRPLRGHFIVDSALNNMILNVHSTYCHCTERR